MYKKITHNELAALMNKVFNEKSKGESAAYSMKIALHINKTSVTVKNCFNLSTQVVSDEIFTKVCNYIGLDVKTEWHKGSKTYFINKKTK
jgi:hypothetical protein